MLTFSHLSFWEKETFLSNIDFLIIGSGIVGLSTAIHLKKKYPKKKIVILERGYLPSGASTKNAGFACIGSASELLDDIENTTENDVFTTVEKRWKGLHYLRQLLSDDKIDYQKLGSYELFEAKERELSNQCFEKLSFLNKQLEQITNIPRVYQTANQQISKSNFSNFTTAISNSAEGQINTGKMMKNLVRLAQELGVIILNGIEVKQISLNSVLTNYGKIEFNKLALCTNGIAKQFLPKEDIQPVRAQVIVTSEIENLQFEGTYHFDKGYYYFRNIGNRVLFGGGRNLNFETEETDELNTSDQIINQLSSIIETNILPNSAFTIEHQWAGTMGVGKGKNPIIKQVSENTFCGVRLGGMGVAIGTLVGKELAELMH